MTKPKDDLEKDKETLKDCLAIGSVIGFFIGFWLWHNIILVFLSVIVCLLIGEILIERYYKNDSKAEDEEFKK